MRRLTMHSLKYSNEWHDSWKWIELEARWIPNWLNEMQISAMFKGDYKLPFITKLIGSLPLISPSWLMSASFHFYEFKEGNKHSLAHPKISPFPYISQTWERRGSFPKKGLLVFSLTSPMKEKSVLFMFRESEQRRKKTPKGHFS